MNQKILVLGGTGAMGNHLVKILSEAGYPVYVTTRGMRESKGNVIYIQGNAHDETFLNKLFREHHFDCVIDFMVYNTPEFKGRYEFLLRSTRQYVFLSSARVYAQSNSLITEESPRLLDVCKDEEYLATDDYALTKARQEDILYKSNYKNWTIIRPYITFSEIRLQLGVFEKEDWLFRALRGEAIVFSRDIAPHLTALTYGYDVARGIAGLVGNQEALGETFHIATAESHTWEEIARLYVDTLKEITGKSPRLTMVDRCFFLDHDRAKFSVKYSRLFDYRYDNSKILRFVPGLTFRPTLEGLRDCLRTFMQQPSFRSISPYVQANLDRDGGGHLPLSVWGSSHEKFSYLFHRYMPSFILTWRKRHVRSKQEKMNKL